MTKALNPDSIVCRDKSVYEQHPPPPRSFHGFGARTQCLALRKIRKTESFVSDRHPYVQELTAVENILQNVEILPTFWISRAELVEFVASSVLRGKPSQFPRRRKDVF